jgi:hypothetical protein
MFEKFLQNSERKEKKLQARVSMGKKENYERRVTH